MGYFETEDQQQLSGFMTIPDVPEATVWHKADIRLQQTIIEMLVTHWQLKYAALTADTLDRWKQQQYYLAMLSQSASGIDSCIY